MNKTELKVTYNKMRYMQKKLVVIDWSNPNKKDIEFNSRIQKSIYALKNTLTNSELNFLKVFETEKNSNHLNQLKQRSSEMKSNFVKVVYNGGGWYTFSPSAHKFYNRNDEIKSRGVKGLDSNLKDCGKWSVLGKQVVGF